MQRSERIQALEEAIRCLQSVKTDPAYIGELEFDDARVDSLVTTALSAARAALAAATKRGDLVEEAPPNR